MNIWFNDPMCACLSLQSFKQEVILGTGAQAYDARSYFFLLFFIYFYASVQRNVTYTAHIHYFKTTEFEYAKRPLTFQKMKAMCYNGLNL